MIPPEPPPPRRRGWRRYRVLLYFVLGVLLLDALVFARRDLWQLYSPDDYAERLRGCRRQAQDIIVVGGSPVSEGIDPGVLAGMEWQGRRLERAYALGLPGGTTSEFWHAVKHGARRPPKLLVYGITASDLNDRRHEPHGPYSLMTWGDLFSWVRRRPESAEWVTRHFVQARFAHSWQLFRHRNGIRMWLADVADSHFPGSFPKAAEAARINRAYAEALRTGNGYAPNAGFVHRRYDLVKAEVGPQKEFAFLNGFRMGSHLSYLHRMLDWADANGVTVVLVDMPVTVDLEEGLYPDAFRQYRAALAEVERTRRVIVLRASRSAVGLDDSHFADLIHLNADGAGRLSRWIRERLERAERGTRSAERGAERQPAPFRGASDGAFLSLPPCGGGSGWGVGLQAVGRLKASPPTLTLPRKGGGQKTEDPSLALRARKDSSRSALRVPRSALEGLG